MTLKETNKRIEELFKEWKSLQPLKPEDEERFNKKVRLEWNYNSNHIEGNTLTYGETELLLIEGKEEGIHPERDYMEMKAHDLAINKIREFSENKKRKLTESDIRGLNKLILKEPFWKEAITADGQKTQKEIIPGEYKTQPNHVRTETGGVFKFTEPHDVPAKMKDLMDWFNKEMEKPTLSISSFLAELHHRFIIIHPFDDGNGRITRLWMNYVLLRFGYTPLVIKSEEKRNYFAALQKADDGDMNTLAVYLGNVLIYWLEIGIKAAKGEDISELEDVDKETELFIRNQELKGFRTPLAYDNFEEIYANNLSDLFEGFIKEFSKHAKLFYETSLEVGTGKTLLSTETTKFGWLNKNSVAKDETIKKFNEELSNYFVRLKSVTERLVACEEETVTTFILFDYHTFIGQSVLSFDIKSILSIYWNEFSYEVFIEIVKAGKNGDYFFNKGTELKEKQYGGKWSETEKKKFFAEGKKLFLEALKEMS